MIPKPLTDKSIRYTFFEFDKTLHDVATRYGITRTDIYAASRELPQFAKVEKESTFVAMVETVNLVPRDVYQLVSNQKKTGKLKDFVTSWMGDVGGLTPTYQRSQQGEQLVVCELIRMNQGLSYEQFVALFNSWKNIVVPYSDDDKLFEWMAYKCGEGTDYRVLGDVRKAAAKDPLRSTMDPLKSSQILDYLLNSKFRTQVLSAKQAAEGMQERQPFGGESQEQANARWRATDIKAAQDLAAQPSDISLDKNTTIWVPFPYFEVSSIAVAPSNSKGGSQTPSTGQTSPVPEWVDKLFYGFLLPMHKETKKLVKANKACAKLRTECGRHVARLAVLDRLLKYMETDNQAELDALRAKLITLQDDATKYMTINPAGILAKPYTSKEGVALKGGYGPNEDRKSASEALDKLIGDADFLSYVLQAIRAPELQVSVTASLLEENAAGLRQVSLWALAFNIWWFAFAAQVEAGLSELGYGAIEKSFQAIGAGKPVEESPGEAFFSLIGGGSSIFATSVGNLPGPPSFAVALMGWRTERTVLKIVDRSATHAAETKVLVDKLYKVEQALGIEKSLLLEVGYGKLDGPARAKQAREIAEAYAGNVQSSVGWNMTIAGVNALSFFLSLKKLDWTSDSWKDFFVDRDFVSATGATINAAVGALTIFAKPDGPVEKLCSTNGWGNKLGRVAGFLTVAVAAWEMGEVLEANAKGEKIDPVDAVVKGLNLGGSILVLCATPGLQLIGTTALIVSSAIQLWPTVVAMIKDSPRESVKNLILDNFKLFREKSLVGRISDIEPALAKSLSAFETALNGFDHYGSLQLSWEVDGVLIEMGFTDVADRTKLMNGRPIWNPKWAKM